MVAFKKYFFPPSETGSQYIGMSVCYLCIKQVELEFIEILLHLVFCVLRWKLCSIVFNFFILLFTFYIFFEVGGTETVALSLIELAPIGNF